MFNACNYYSSIYCCQYIDCNYPLKKRNSSPFLAPLCHLAAELFKCRLVRRRRRRRRHRRRRHRRRRQL